MAEEKKIVKLLPNKLNVMRASAGSGKTYTLAKLYIEKLLWDDNGNIRFKGKDGKLFIPEHGYHEHILAITFTNKATEEMKSRIVEELYKLSVGRCDYSEEFLKLHPNTTSDELKEIAKIALQTLLFDYSTFNVSTIDSFFQTILRTFAHELKQDMDYEVQIDSDYVKLQAIHNFLATLGEKDDSDVSNWVRDFIQENANSDNKDWNFFNDKSIKSLKEFAAMFDKENFSNYRDAFKAYIDGPDKKLVKLRVVIQAIITYCQYASDEKRFKEEVKNLLTGVLINGGKINADYISKSANIGKFILGESDGWKDTTVQTLLNNSNNPDALDKLIKGGKKYKTTEVQKAISANATKYCTLTKNFAEAFLGVSRYKKLLNSIWKMGMISKINEHIDGYRKETNSILIADTTDLIARILKSDVPFIYERVGVWIHNFMIDEFQDTSSKQYSNFKDLLDNSLGEGHSDLIIGDEKQSIYRFRNSDPDLLRCQIKKDFSAYDDSQPLGTNYRSFPNVIKFNNEFFRILVDDFGGQLKKLVDTYSNLEQATKKQQRNGNVRINFFYDQDKARIDKGPRTKPYYKDENGEYLKAKDQVLSVLPDYIYNLHHDYDFNYKDIIILVNTNSEGVAVVNSLLDFNEKHKNTDKKHIEVMSNEALLLKNSPAVRLIISMLRYVDSTLYHQPEVDEVDLDNVDYRNLSSKERILLNRINEQLHYQALHEFSQIIGNKAEDDADYGELLREAVQNIAKFRGSKEQQLKDLQDNLSILSSDIKTEQSCLTGLIDKIIKEYLQDTRVIKEGYETAYLLAFQSLAHNFAGQQNSGGTVHEFLNFWDTKCDKLAIPSGADSDAIQVMTIHKSKGLQAPCIIIPFANWELLKDDDLLWTPQSYVVNPLQTVVGEITKILKSNKDMDPKTRAIIERGIKLYNDDIVPPIMPVSSTFLKGFDSCLPFYLPIAEDSVIDNINKTYVAFTRAAQSLHIFMNASPSADKKNLELLEMMRLHINARITSDIAKMENLVGAQYLWEKNLDEGETWNSEWDVKAIKYVEFGAQESCYHDEKEADEDASIIVKKPMPDYVVTSGLDSLTVDLPELVTPEQEQGTALHRVFARIRYKKDVPRALNYAVKRRIVGDDEPTWTIGKLKEIVDNMFVDERTKDWFADDNIVYNERTLSSDDDKINGRRPDRVIIRPDGTCIIVDYKFGNAGSDQQKADYIEEVRGYMYCMRAAGYSNVKGYLWYVKHDDIQEVSLY